MIGRPPPHPLRAVLALERVTVTDLARQLGVNRHTLTRWLDRREPVPAARRRQLAELVGLPPDVCFDEDSTQARP